MQLYGQKVAAFEVLGVAGCAERDKAPPADPVPESIQWNLEMVIPDAYTVTPCVCNSLLFHFLHSLMVDYHLGGRCFHLFRP